MSGDTTISPFDSVRSSSRLAARLADSMYPELWCLKLSFLMGSLREFRPESRDRTESVLFNEKPDFLFTCGWFELAKAASEAVSSRLSRGTWDGKECIPPVEALAWM